MKFPESAKKIILQRIDPNLIKEREVGGKSFSYISGYTVIDILNAAFDYMWDWEISKEWVEECIPFFNSYAKEPAEELVTNKGKKGLWEAQAPVAHVKGILTVYIKDDDGTIRTIKKTGYGSKCIIGKQAEQDSIFKSAATDALKKAASFLGIGAELYRNEEEQQYFDMLNYNGPWTEEAISEHESDYNYLINFINTYEIDEDEMRNYVKSFNPALTNGFNSITPDNINNFVKFIENLIKNDEAIN